MQCERDFEAPSRAVTTRRGNRPGRGLVFTLAGAVFDDPSWKPSGPWPGLYIGRRSVTHSGNHLDVRQATGTHRYRCNDWYDGIDEPY